MFGIGSGNGSFGFRFFCVQLEQLSSPPPCCQYPAVKPVNEQLFDPAQRQQKKSCCEIKIKKVYLGVDICVMITYISIKLNKPMENKMEIGDRIKVIDQEIYGKIVWIHSNEVVIEDEDAETEDNTLAFKKSEVEEITGETNE